jgi:regulatory protein YycH of two-component signal transduction system YycFG
MMQVVLCKTGEPKKIVVEQLEESDYKIITKSKYHFIWKDQKSNDVYKLRLIENEEILGLISLKVHIN